MSEISAAEQSASAVLPAPPPAMTRSARRAATTDPTDGIGRRVAAYRADRGMRVSDLAREVGVSPSLVSQIERGQSRPSVSTLFAISEALGVPVDAFFREIDPDRQPGAGASGATVSGTTAGRATLSPVVSSGNPAGDTGPAGILTPSGAATLAAVDPSAPANPGGTPERAHESRYVVRRAQRPVIDIESGVRWERLTPGALKNVEFLELIYGPGAESSATLYRHPGEEMILILSGELDIYLGFECYHLTAGDSMHFPSMQPHRYVNPTGETTRAVTTILHEGEWYATPRHDGDG